MAGAAGAAGALLRRVVKTAVGRERPERRAVRGKATSSRAGPAHQDGNHVGRTNSSVRPGPALLMSDSVVFSELIERRESPAACFPPLL